MVFVTTVMEHWLQQETLVYICLFDKFSMFINWHWELFHKK